jgi:CubicO group peptidase (beta-lactamase class C family)
MPKGFKLQPLAQQVTPLQLADFTSGMPDDPTNLPRQLEMRSIEHYTVKDFLHWISGWKPASPPPAPYLYSNAGIGLLSYLLADATGKAWEEQLNDELLGPLGMKDTELRPSPEQKKRMAQGHRRNGTDAPPWPIYAWFAAETCVPPRSTQAMRERLEAAPNMLEAFPDKPKGMHWRTYEQLRPEHDRSESGGTLEYQHLSTLRSSSEDAVLSALSPLNGQALLA